jgi:maltose alpha-D-glucosyltransferase/alpha-amylase
MMKKLQALLKQIYGNESDWLLTSLEHPILSAKRSFNVEPKYTDTEWCKRLNLYCVYPNAIQEDKKQSPLANIALYINKLEALGFNGIHILPFLQSPLIDKGFDISDFYQVQPELGTLEELLYVKAVAGAANIRVFMDMLFYHVSDQHEWFIRAQAGEARFREYFLHTQLKPTLLKIYTENSSVWAEYDVDNSVVKLAIMFPDHNEELPHWRCGTDGYWYYHSYYPQQIELNWQNPEVFLAMAQVLIYWAKLGFNFRLDSILFIGKPAYKTDGCDSTKTHLLMAALRCIVDMIDPSLAFLAESFSDMQSIKTCLGVPEQVQANLAYNFHLSTKLWLTVLNHDSEILTEMLQLQQGLPQHATWLNFLRNHDELSLGHLEDATRLTFYQTIQHQGMDFRNGCGISGRTFSLLNGDVQRFMMAYFLLASCPGAMMLPFGDEFALANIPFDSLSKLEQKDTRNINRGLIHPSHQHAITPLPDNFF